MSSRSTLDRLPSSSAQASLKDRYSKIWAGVLALLAVVHCGAAELPQRAKDERATPDSLPKGATLCLPEGGGFMRARLSGSIKADLSWENDGTECSGATRPSGGVRMRFSHAFGKSSTGTDIRLVLVFGIPGLREGAAASNLPVNLTVIREGAGQFFGTRGDDKCNIEKLEQVAVAGPPLRNRSYRVTARGFCTQPARAIAGDGAVLMSRFDFTGRIDYSEEDREPDTPTLARAVK